MGNGESTPDTVNRSEQPHPQNNKYEGRYNLVPSFRNTGYETIDEGFYDNHKTTTDVPNYFDLRTSFPNITDVGTFPLNPIASVAYVLEYALLKNELGPFPPSLLYIYKYTNFYTPSNKLLSLESIFKSVKTMGFCIENEFRTTKKNLENGIVSDDLREKAAPYKFLKIYRVVNKLEIIKSVLLHKYPILVGFTVYYKMSRINTKFWNPDPSIEFPMGGLSGVLVGYIEDQQMFIMAQTYGTNFGQNGYIMVPYDYILNQDYTFEMYVLDLDKQRVDGYLSQEKPVLSSQIPAPQQSGGFLSNLFN